MASYRQCGAGREHNVLPVTHIIVIELPCIQTFMKIHFINAMIPSNTKVLMFSQISVQTQSIRTKIYCRTNFLFENDRNFITIKSQPFVPSLKVLQILVTKSMLLWFTCKHTCFVVPVKRGNNYFN